MEWKYHVALIQINFLNHCTKTSPVLIQVNLNGTQLSAFFDVRKVQPIASQLQAEVPVPRLSHFFDNLGVRDIVKYTCPKQLTEKFSIRKFINYKFEMKELYRFTVSTDILYSAPFRGILCAPAFTGILHARPYQENNIFSAFKYIRFEAIYQYTIKDTKKCLHISENIK